MNPAQAELPPFVAQGDPSAVPMSAWLALATLVMLELALLTDRELLVLLTDPIKHALSASDLQIGLLQGVGVGVVGAVAGYPLGWLADRHDRRLILAGCVLVWAVTLLASALAPSFAWLFVTSSLSTLGFAGLMPVSYSIIPALFSGAQRQLANSVVSIAGNLGRGIVVVACGGLIHAVGVLQPQLPAALQSLDVWRVALLLALLPLPLMLLGIARLPLAARRAAPVASQTPGGSSEAPAAPVSMAQFLGQHRRAFIGLFGGMTVAVLAFSPLFVWLPVSVMRSFGDTPAQTGAAMGAASIVAALAGVGIAVFVLPRMQRRFGEAMPINVVIGSTSVAVVTTLALLAAQSAQQVYITMGVQLSFMMAAIMVFPTMLQDIAPTTLRGRMAALLGMVTTVGTALGPPLVGVISDQLALSGHADALLLAVVALGAVGFSLAGGLFWSARHPFAIAVADARRIDAGTA